MPGTVDRLTGGPSEMLFQQMLERRLASGPLPFAFVSINLKRFGSINAVYGRETGDQVLRIVYHALHGVLREGEFISRVHTNTYFLLLDEKEEDSLWERIRLLDDAVYFCPGLAELKKVFLAVGSCFVTDRDETYDHVVDCANYSRTNSPDRFDENTHYEIYGVSVKDTRARSTQLLAMCRSALEQGHFQVYYQPKYELGGETVAGAEGLIRWKDPAEGMIPLSEFMPPFEESGFTRQLDYFVFETVLRFQQRRLHAGRPVVPISVNLSKTHFTNMTFFTEKFLPLFQKYDVPPQYVEFEISESLMLEAYDRLPKFVEELNQYGFVCSMDDFGSGYSSLNSVKTLPVAVLKLDGKMFTEAAKERGKVVIEGILRIARGLGMKVVAEGVETREYVDFLKQHGCDMVQGYYFSRPVPEAEFEALLP